MAGTSWGCAMANEDEAQLTIAGYRVEAVVGRGAMGVVYRARSVHGDQLALKVVPCAGDVHLAESLAEQAARLATVDQRGIIEVREVALDGDSLVLAMVYADQGSLSQRLVHGSVDLSEMLGWLANAANGLAAAHDVEVLHGDIKPSSVLLVGEPDRSPRSGLSDIGVARLVGSGPGVRHVSLGTADYLDPECIQTETFTSKGDVYSFGIVCYEAFTGRRPYEARSPTETFLLADRAQAEPLAELAPHLSSQVCEVVQAAMARHPADRPQACELAEGLLAAWGACSDQTKGRTLASAAPAHSRVLTPSRSRRTADQSRSKEQKGRKGHKEAGVRAQRRRGPLLTRARVAGAAPTGGRARAGAAVGVAVAVTVVAVAGLLVAAHLRVGVEPTRQDAQAAGGQRPGCAPAAVGHPQHGAQTLVADVRGTGCPTEVSWRHNVVTVALQAGRPAVRFRLGLPGDQLLLGNWDCGNRATAALYRPSNGDVILFSGWASSAPISGRVVRTGRAGGHAEVVRTARTLDGRRVTCAVVVIVRH